MATFVLIHAGGSSAWDWHLVEPELRALGHDTVAVDLPVEDDAGFPECVDAVVEAVGGRTDLVVVAHSYGGFTGPLVCDRLPVELLVLVTAMIPKPGEPPADWWSATGHDKVERPEGEVAQFMHDLSPELIEQVYEHGREGTGTYEQPWPLAALPDVPTRFLLCRDDRFFPPEFMRRVVRERLGIEPDEIDGGHYIALSRPRELAERLHAYVTSSNGG